MLTRTCRLVTLGCKVNQYETQHVKETLELNGYREAAMGEAADLCVVNTCTVTQEADAKARQLVRRLVRCNPRAAIVVMGCYATRDPEGVRKLPGVVKVITDKSRVTEELREFGVRQAALEITRFDGHQRAFVKVQDGCLLNCTFCVIPSVRPVLRSRTPEEIEAEVRGLVERGCPEIVLTGIHLGHYGIDLSRGRPKAQWRRLWHLLDRLEGIPGEFRVRLSSLEAAEARPDLVAAIRDNRRPVPHLHLCLQSGSDRVLARMRRRYRVRSFLDRCEELKNQLDQPALTTDIIVGFPGETEEDFEATCRVAREVGFAQMHVFPFSPRAGTPAAEMPDRVPAEVIGERKARLAQLADELEQTYLSELVGRRLEVMVEKVHPSRSGFVVGMACRRVEVAFEASPALVRRLAPIEAIGVWEENRLLGRPVPGTFANRFDNRRPLSQPGKPRLPLPLLGGTC